MIKNNALVMIVKPTVAIEKQVVHNALKIYVLLQCVRMILIALKILMDKYVIKQQKNVLVFQRNKIVVMIKPKEMLVEIKFVLFLNVKMMGTVKPILMEKFAIKIMHVLVMYLQLIVIIYKL